MTPAPPRQLIPAGAGRTPSPWAWRLAGGAHPRWRGEDSRGRRAGTVCGGSSPLARGGPVRLVQCPDLIRLIPAGAGRTSTDERDRPTALRLIPAGAGRTSTEGPRCPGRSAHPRWRGEDVEAQASPNGKTGSSPLARGGRTYRWAPGSGAGLIPAGAGRTVGTQTDIFAPRAHPRWRGEDPGLTRSSISSTGSSPLARGGLLSGSLWTLLVGLIPAGAGRTWLCLYEPRKSTAHPRWRGEDPPTCKCAGGRGGSSPLARGGRADRHRGAPRRRLIPAGAGRTGTVSFPGSSSWAHPRWRGEDAATIIAVLAALGSSPLARGGRPRGRPAGVTRRLIPAGAGRTRPGPVVVGTRPAHPRWRGEDTRRA